jgi:signal peptidase
LFKAYFVAIRQFYITTGFENFRVEKMERAKSALKWDQRTDLVKTGIVLLLVVGTTLGGYTVFMFAMGTTTPLVVVTSESMVPTLEVGDLLILRGVPEDQIQVGNIIVYNDTEDYTWITNPIVHRIIDIQEVDGELRFYTKGDANLDNDDGYRRYDEIVGVMVLRIPFIGHVSMFLKTELGLAFMAIIFILILVVPEFACKDSEDKEMEIVTIVDDKPSVSEEPPS